MPDANSVSLFLHFFCATLNTLQFPSFRPSSYVPPPSSLWEINSGIYFDCQGDDVVLRKFFIVWGLYVFIARAQHVVQPKGQELTFSKCLCRLLFLCGFFKGQTKRGGRGRGENLFSLYMCSQAIIDNDSIISYCYRHEHSTKNMGCSLSVAIALLWWSSEPGLQSDYRDTLAITLYPDRPV